jgi:hypothetical protein
MRRAWSVHGGRSAVLARGRQCPGAIEAAPETDKWAPVIFLRRFSNTHNLIFEKVIFLMSKFRQMFHRDSWNYKEQLSFLTQLQIPKGLQGINFGINSNLNLP